MSASEHKVERSGASEQIWRVSGDAAERDAVTSPGRSELNPGRTRPGRRRRLARLRTRGALRRNAPGAFQLEVARPILIRYSDHDDRAALERLAALDSRILPAGSFLLAEVENELVAAAPLDVDDEPLSDPFRRTANVRELLRLQAPHVSRNRNASARPLEAALSTQRAAA